MEQEKLLLQKQAETLAQRLDAVISGKFGSRDCGFDSDTPIDKTQAFLQGVIKVGSLLLVPPATEAVCLVHHSFPLATLRELLSATGSNHSWPLCSDVMCREGRPPNRRL